MYFKDIYTHMCVHTNKLFSTWTSLYADSVNTMMSMLFKNILSLHIDNKILSGKLLDLKEPLDFGEQAKDIKSSRCLDGPNKWKTTSIIWVYQYTWKDLNIEDE